MEPNEGVPVGLSLTSGGITGEGVHEEVHHHKETEVRCRTEGKRIKPTVQPAACTTNTGPEPSSSGWRKTSKIYLEAGVKYLNGVPVCEKKTASGDGPM